MILSAAIIEDIRCQASLIAGGYPGFAREVLRDGPASIAFVPDRADLVVKLIKPGITPFGNGIAEEYASLERFASITGERFVLPRALGMGRDPDFLVMNRLGPSLGSGWKAEMATPGFIKHIGFAVGEFAGKLFNAHRAMHMDLFLDNLTLENGRRIGVIDMASVSPCDEPERMFVCPVLDNVNICPAMAHAFTQETGIRIDIDRVEELTGYRWKFRFEKATLDNEDIKLRKIFVEHFEEWRMAERDGLATIRRSPATSATLG